MNAAPACRILDRLGTPYALIGAHAMAVRGYPRFTVDVDFLSTDPRVLDHQTWAALIAEGASVDCRRGDVDDPVAGVARIHLPDATEVDVLLARWQWEAALIDRSLVMRVMGVDVRVPSRADLILLKLAAGGFGDLQDAAALLSLGDRDAVVRDVETHVMQVRPDVRDAWQRLVAETSRDR